MSSEPTPQHLRLPKVPATSASRATAKSFCRPFPTSPTPESNPTIAARSPALSWTEERLLTLGLRPRAIPAGTDLETPRPGRAVRCKLSTPQNRGCNDVELNVAIFAVSPSETHVPPYPGIPPINADQPNSISRTYVDGSRGCWDTRMYPQLFYLGRPWLPHHRLLESYNWDPAVCEYMSPIDFFYFNDPLQPGKGGNWMITRLDSLFSERELTEAHFANLVQHAQKLGKSFNFNNEEWRKEAYEFPCFDHTTWEDARGWNDWISGRERLGHTLQYVAELKAINNWLRHQIEHLRGVHEDPFPPLPGRPMGTWGATIPNSREWKFLVQYGVPIYIITRIPEDHPLFSQIVDGNLDGDERYRQDAFEAELNLPPCWIVDKRSAPNDAFPPVPDFGLECRPEYLPSSLLPVVPVPRAPRASINSRFLNWRSPIFLDPTIRRFNTDTFGEHVARFRDRYDLLLSMPALNIDVQFLDAAKHRHPLLDLIGPPPDRSGKLRKFEEVREGNIFWPRLLGRRTNATKNVLNSADYQFNFPKENVMILSDEPFPGLPRSFGRLVHYPLDDEDSDDELFNFINPKTNPDPSHGQPDCAPRQYHAADRTGLEVGDYKFTWEYNRPMAQIVQRTVGRPYPIDLNLSTHFNSKDRADHTAFLNKQQLILVDNSVTQVAYDYLSTNTIPTLSGDAAIMADYITGIRKPREGVPDWAKMVVQCDVEALRQQEDQRRLAEESARRLEQQVDERMPMPTEDIMLTEQQAPAQVPISTSDSIPVEQQVAERPQVTIASAMRIHRQLSDQRMRLRNQKMRRIFKSMGGDHLLSPLPIAWPIPAGDANAHICYPVRISGFHRNAPMNNIFSMLLLVGGILRIDDVLLYSLDLEVDNTQTINLALRYCEDLFWIAAVLSGVLVDNSFLDVELLSGISGKGHDIPYPTSTRSPRLVRNRLLRITPFAAYSGSPAYLHRYANVLRRNLRNRLQRMLGLAPEDINQIGTDGNEPTVQMITDLPSLLDDANWTTHPVTLPESRTHGLTKSHVSVTIPADDTNLSYDHAMEGDIYWTIVAGESGRQDAIRGSQTQRNTKRNAIKRVQLPDTMTEDSVRSLLRGIQGRCDRVRNLWRPIELQNLPPLVFTPRPPSQRREEIVESYNKLWDWQDACLSIMHAFRDQDPTPPYDFKPFEDAYGTFTRLGALRGDWHTIICHELANRNGNVALASP